jgi:hypothetical protein
MSEHFPTKIPTFTPTMLASFERCPQQYQLKYVLKERPAEDFSANLACGSAVHRVLASFFEQFRRTGGFPIDLRQRVQAQLPIAQHPSEEAWVADVERVLGWVKWALSAFDGTARVVAVERSYEYLFPGSRDGAFPAFRLRHTVDLVLEREEGAIEHLDWKTGNGYRIDDLQNVAARIVVGQAFPDRPRFLSSTAFLANEAMRTDELSYEAIKVVWEGIKGLVQAISIEQDWLPVANPLCPWCVFYGQGCPLYPGVDAPDAMTGWLEAGAA